MVESAGLKIRSKSMVTAEHASVRDIDVISNQHSTFSAYAKDIYKHLGIKYPKFFKMDELCQLAFLATELLLQDVELGDGAKTAIILGNQSSSEMSDRRHYDSIADPGSFFPSPAVFVYTLPNIMLGEICIRHKIMGENSCFLMEKLQSEFLFTYISKLFDEEGYNHCITGFVNYSKVGYSAELYHVTKADNLEGEKGFDFDKNFNEIIFE